MGILSDALRALIPQAKQVTRQIVPAWAGGVPQQMPLSYETFAREGYSRNELVYACIEELATSAAEPRIAAYRRTPEGLERLDAHPILDLLERPNPFTDRFTFWATVITHLAIAGNAYAEKVRSRAGRVVELWLWRPDWVRVVPDPERFISHYVVQVGGQSYRVEPRDMVHFKTRHPLDQFYGMPPLMVAAGRVDLDNYMRQFVRAFFENAGVPMGLLTVNRVLTEEQRRELQGRFRQEFGGPSGWHRLMVMEGAEAKFEAMGMPLGQRGLVLPELDEITETRICMVFGVPPILVGSRLGLQRSTYANYREARASFWDETLVPLYKMLAARLNLSLVPDFAGVDEVQFDLSDVQALQEDRDAVHERARRNAQAGIWTIEEARLETGKEAEPDPAGHLLLPLNVVPTRVSAALGMAETPAEEAPAGGEEQAKANGQPRERAQVLSWPSSR